MIVGIGDWAQSPIPNPQSPIPNPQSPIPNVIEQKTYSEQYNIIANSFYKKHMAFHLIIIYNNK